jgi:NADH-quinone oxidoreductase subunit M
MFSSPIFRYELIIVPAAGLCIILGAVYMLKMVQKVLYGQKDQLIVQPVAGDIRFNEKLALGILVVLILVAGIYPQPFLDLTSETTETVLREANVIPFLRK